jgi:hypothetical protein
VHLHISALLWAGDMARAFVLLTFHLSALVGGGGGGGLFDFSILLSFGIDMNRSYSSIGNGMLRTITAAAATLFLGNKRS